MKSRTLAGVVPAVGFSLLPTIACPACLPALASVLGAAGLSFVAESRYLPWFNFGSLSNCLSSSREGRATMGFNATRSRCRRRHRRDAGQIRLEQLLDLVERPGGIHAGIDLEWHLAEKIEQDLYQLWITG